MPHKLACGMDPLSDAQEFGRRVRSARGYLGLGRSEFAALLGYSGDSTIERMERGEIGKKRANRAGRLQLAEEIIRRTGAPAAIFEIGDIEPSSAVEILRRLDRLEQALGLVDDEPISALESEDDEIAAADREYSAGASPAATDIAEQSA